MVDEIKHFTFDPRASEFGFAEKWISTKRKPLLNFQNVKRKLQNLVRNKSYGSLKIAYRFPIFAQKMQASLILWKPGN